MRHPAFSLECGLFNIVPYDKVRTSTTVEEEPSGSVVESYTWDRRITSSRLARGTVLSGFAQA